MNAIIKKIPSSQKTKQMRLNDGLMILKRATVNGVSGELIKTMNYIDLQCLVFSLEIDGLSKHLKQLQLEQDAKNGIASRTEASEEDFNSL